jgi:hypothetical protein
VYGVSEVEHAGEVVESEHGDSRWRRVARLTNSGVEAGVGRLV